MAWFRSQLEIALARKLPLFLHVRDAREDFVAILKESGFPEEGPTPVKACVHCFTGDTEELKEYVKMASTSDSQALLLIITCLR